MTPFSAYLAKNQTDHHSKMWKKRVKPETFESSRFDVIERAQDKP